MAKVNYLNSRNGDVVAVEAGSEDENWLKRNDNWSKVSRKQAAASRSGGEQVPAGGVDADAVDPDEVVDNKPPAKNAGVDVWRAWAKGVAGPDAGEDELAEIDKAGKAELIKKYGDAAKPADGSDS